MKRTFAFILSALLSVPFFANAQEMPAPLDNEDVPAELIANRPEAGTKGKKDFRRKGRDKFQSLELTDAQKEKLKQIKLDAMKESQPLRNKQRVLKAELESLQEAAKPNLRSINKKIDELSANMAAMMKVRAASRQAIRSELTEEQRLKFDAMAGRAKHKMAGKKGRGHNKGRGHGGSHKR
ncbi:hypothetical protein FUAX_36040 [Fulvitalea axinellae]|uniref:Periplasmic heavy metal sensor n=1 Tax=Fulvitalea axinellae TaxID=1182444 RepID=A0AAU9CT41_9BACT|nr:hypothetical protein FUAX_36040 [Fulvitalea axinellae]